MYAGAVGADNSGVEKMLVPAGDRKLVPGEYRVLGLEGAEGLKLGGVKGMELCTFNGLASNGFVPRGLLETVPEEAPQISRTDSAPFTRR